MNLANLPAMPTTVEEVRRPEYLLLDAMSGSRAYGLATETSDTDWKGVYVQPMLAWLGFTHQEQINNATNDECYYELGRFAHLAARNNPTVLELLATPADCVRYRHPLMDHFSLEMFLSKVCHESFTGFAVSQLKRAQGLNKKIMQPMPAQRKTALDFCFVLADQGSVPLTAWLEARGWDMEHCGLVAIPHVPDTYGLYYDASGEHAYRGVFSSADSVEILLSSVPRGVQPVGWLSYHFQGYQTHCRQHQEYWEWVAARNPERYESTRAHGQGYDAKNLMHTFRLLDIAKQIAVTGTFTVRTQQREALLNIKRGAHSYAELLAQAKAQVAELSDLFAQSALPDQPDFIAIERHVIQVRREFYGV